MRQIKKLIFMFFSLGIILSFNNTKVYAANGSISFSDPTATIGSEVTVKVNVSTTDNTMLGGVDLTLAYDASALEFVSGTSASGSSGTIRIAGVIDNASSTSLSYNLTFKALKAGTSKLTVSSYEIISLDYEPIAIDKVGNSSVSIKEKEEVKASSDCTLSLLAISPGTLSPAFSPKTIEYSATVSYETSKIALSAIPNDSKAAVTGVTKTDLDVGQNTIKVIVTAESGADVAYVINITREEQDKQEETEETKQEEELAEQQKTIDVTIGDASYVVLSDIPKEAIPTGFEKSTYIYKDNEVVSLKPKEGDLVLFYLEGQAGVELFSYDESTDSFTKYSPLSLDVSLNVLEFDSSITIPQGYTQTSLTLNDRDVMAYQNNENPDFYLLYCQNNSGEKKLYLYDAAENSIQRYTELGVEENTNTQESETITNLQKDLLKLKTDTDTKLLKKMYWIYGLGILDLILFMVMCLTMKMLVSNKNKSNKAKVKEVKNENKEKGKKTKGLNTSNHSTKINEKREGKVKIKEVVKTKDENVIEDKKDEFKINFVDFDKEDEFK